MFLLIWFGCGLLGSIIVLIDTAIEDESLTIRDILIGLFIVLFGVVALSISLVLLSAKYVKIDFDKEVWRKK